MSELSKVYISSCSTRCRKAAQKKITLTNPYCLMSSGSSLLCLGLSLTSHQTAIQMWWSVQTKRPHPAELLQPQHILTTCCITRLMTDSSDWLCHKNAQTKQWTGRDSVMYVTLSCWLLKRQWFQANLNLRDPVWINMTQSDWLLGPDEPQNQSPPSSNTCGDQNWKTWNLEKLGEQINLPAKAKIHIWCGNPSVPHIVSWAKWKLLFPLCLLKHSL